jgi:hypothetical protein
MCVLGFGWRRATFLPAQLFKLDAALTPVVGARQPCHPIACEGREARRRVYIRWKDVCDFICLEWTEIVLLVVVVGGY